MTMTFEIGVSYTARPHLLADLAELLLLVRYDRASELSHASFRTYLKEMAASAEDAEDDSFSASTEPKEKDATDRELEDCWAQLEYRMKVFDSFYPFSVSGDRLLWRRGRRSTKQRVYLFLLACARLRSFARSFRQTAASAFVEMAREALRALAGAGAEVRIFDANSDDRRGYYGVDLRVALKTLGKDLAAHAIHNAHIDSISASGDAGLDLVAVHPFNDSASGHHAILGQCASRETEWPAKRFEAHPLALGAYFHILHGPENVVFIPGCFRNATGEWVASAKTTGCLLVDRLRLLRLLDERWNSAQAIFKEKCDALVTQLETA
jgi:hypothetical protein